MSTSPKALSITLLLVLGSGLLGLTACSSEQSEVHAYHCPMHPTYLSDKPGDCPICGMRLVPTETADGSAQGEKTVFAEGTHLCPMHPEVGSDDPNERCSKCGMRLVPRAEVVGKGADSRQPAAHSSPAHSLTRVDGMAPVEVTAGAARLAGIQTAPVVRERIGRAVRTVGTVLPDETRVRHVHTKIAGWVERLHVNFTGQAVRAGEPILVLYSPELLASQEEYLRARETAARFSTSALPEVRRGGEDLLHAARRRLELFDVPGSLIAELDRTGAPQRAVTLNAPVSGYVTAKGVFEGHQVEPGMELFTITDLSRVWIEADFYEYETRDLTIGQAASLSLPYDPAVSLAGRIEYVYPTLDPATRTLRVRFDFPNPKTALKPGMFASVELSLAPADALVIPDSAVMDTGERQVVFVETAPGRLEPREVRVGVRSAGRAEVRSGLAEGERVAIKANFLLDSESRLRAAFAAPPPTRGPGVRGPGSEEAGHVH